MAVKLEIVCDDCGRARYEVDTYSINDTVDRKGSPAILWEADNLDTVCEAGWKARDAGHFIDELKGRVLCPVCLVNEAKPNA